MPGLRSEVQSDSKCFVPVSNDDRQKEQRSRAKRSRVTCISERSRDGLGRADAQYDMNRISHIFAWWGLLVSPSRIPLLLIKSNLSIGTYSRRKQSSLRHLIRVYTVCHSSSIQQFLDNQQVVKWTCSKVYYGEELIFTTCENSADDKLIFFLLFFFFFFQKTDFDISCNLSLHELSKPVLWDK